MSKKTELKKDLLCMCLLTAAIAAFVIVIFASGHVFGSKVDWANQHVVIPEEFRDSFYRTGSIFQKFAPELGMGQSVYYMSYYGLYSPIILLSFLFPFIPMYIYMSAAGMISLAVSVNLFYVWVRKRRGIPASFIAAALLLFNSTFFYHFHRQIMFVIYMPFMIGALFGVDRLLKKKRPGLLIVCTLCMILTSYYFSVFGILFIGAYTLYRLLAEEKFSIKPLFSVIGSVAVSVLSAGILLIPTMYALTQGRTPTLTSSVPASKLLLPHSNYIYTFYSSYYSWGVTFIYVMCAVAGILSKKRHRAFVSCIAIAAMLFPFISYIFNGRMYVDGKCYLPFLPIMLYSVSGFIEDAVDGKIRLKPLFIASAPFAVFIAACSFTASHWYIPLLDIPFTYLAVALLVRRPAKREILRYAAMLPMFAVILVSFFFSQSNEGYMATDNLKSINNKAYYDLAEDIDDSWRTSVADDLLITPNKLYSTSMRRTSIYSSLTNQNYFDFMRNVFRNEVTFRDNTTMTQPYNLLFNVYSGTRYLLTSGDLTAGYEPIRTQDGVTLAENPNVMPVGYASDRVMSLREFNTLEYPDTLDALLRYTVVDRDLPDVYDGSPVKKIDVGFKYESGELPKYSVENGHYLVSCGKYTTFNVRLDRKIEDSALIVRFRMNKSTPGYSGSTDVEINGVNNALSYANWKYYNENEVFEYVISPKDDFNTLRIKFKKGEYDISDIETFTIPYSAINAYSENVDALAVDTDAKDVVIKGSVNVKNDGFFKLTVPYEPRGFTLLVDGKATDFEKVDTAFIGFPVTAGEHTVELTFTPPMMNVGAAMSCVGVILFAAVEIVTLIRSKRKA